ncbi:flagellar motor switch protein FliG [Desulfopila inferna]|uniref:flagellar motor switch protein FliG n=1 Tax=Desulfopila inferna TaxID=468528 RepID=UPI0019637F4C|nr:flagellar motor switch protein FliG [Desulfopila inferna]MBM9602970.1 flagellar motor switch protein FliG [Desulfopila inferna]
MSIEDLSNIKKAAVVLMCLGEDATAKIFQEFTDDEIRRVTKAMAVIDHIPSDVKEMVVNTFLEAEKKYAGLFLKGSDFAKLALAKTENERADDLLDQFISGTESRPLETIAMMQARMVAGLLEKEHPQTIALILSTQHVQHAGEILSWLPEEFQADVVYRIAKLEKVSPEVISGIEEALNKELGSNIGREQRQVGGLDKVVDLLGHLQNNLDADILETIEETDPELAEEIRKRMFTFENLVGLDGRSLQMILREVNNDSLTMALKTASDEMKEKIYANMSIRAADMIKDDLEAMGPVRLSEVEAMQQSIVKIAMKLEEEGKIVLNKVGGDEFV